MDAKQLKESGFSNAEIKEYLTKSGFSNKEIVSYLGGREITNPPPEGSITKAPPKWLEGTREVLGGMGMGVGYVAGAATAPVTGVYAPAVGVVMGGAGYATGNKIADLVAQAAGYPNAFKPRRFEKPETNAEAALNTIKDIVTGIKYGAIGDIAGVGIAGGIKAFQPGKTARVSLADVSKYGEANLGKLKPEYAKNLATMEEFGHKAFPAEIIPNSKIINISQKLMEHFPGSTGTIYNAKVAKLIQLNNTRNQLIQRRMSGADIATIDAEIRSGLEDFKLSVGNKASAEWGKSIDEFKNLYGTEEPTIAGRDFSLIYERSRAKVHDRVAQIYNNIPDRLTEKGMDVIPQSEGTTAIAQKWLKLEQMKVGSEQKRGLIRRLKSFAGEQPYTEQELKLLEKAGEKTGAVTDQRTWLGLDETRKDLLERNRVIWGQKGFATKEYRINKELADGIHADMETWANSKGFDDVIGMLQEGRDLSFWEHNLYDKNLHDIVNKDSSQILDYIVSKGRVDLVKQIEYATGEEGLEKLRQGMFNNLLKNAEINDVVSPAKLKKLIENLGGTYNQLTSITQREALQNIIDKGIRIKDTYDKYTKTRMYDFVDKMLKSRDEELVTALLPPSGKFDKQFQREAINMTKQIVGEQRFGDLQAMAVEKVFKMSSTGGIAPISVIRGSEAKGTLLPTKSAQEFAKYEESLRGLLSDQPELFNKMSTFIDMARNMQQIDKLAENLSGTAPSLITYQHGKKLASGVRNILTAHPFTGFKELAEGLFSLGGEKLLAKIYLSPFARNSMIQAWKLRGTEQGTAAFVKALEIIYNDENKRWKPIESRIVSK